MSLKMNPIIVTSGGIYPYSDKLMEYGMRTSRFGDDYQIFCIYGEGKHKRIMVPRNMVPEGSNLQYEKGFDVDFTSTFVARDKKQEYVIREAVQLLAKEESFIIEAPTGCVDRDTEYLSPTGWVAIGDYAGGQVLQFDPTLNKSMFVTPDEYVKLPSETLWEFSTKYGLNQCLSDEHRFLFKTKESPNYQVKQFGWVRRRHESLSYGFAGKVLTTFTPEISTSIPLTDAEIRLQVACMADGHFNAEYTTRVTMRLKKERKIKRIRELLNNAGVAYKERNCNAVDGFVVFSFYAPRKDKHFGKYWWRSSVHQLNIIAQEALYWDGNQQNQFYTTSKRCADFIQYALTTTGKRASIISQDRRGEEHHNSIEYQVSATDRVWVGMESSSTKTPITEVATKDGFKYCFSVPSGFLVLRRKGCIFVTGNSGKTIMAMDIIAQVGKKTVVVVTKEDIRDQWVVAAKTILGLTDAEIGYIQGDVCSVTGKKLVIAMIQSLAKEDRYDQQSFNEFGLAIWDEVHRVSADKFSQSCYRIPAALRLGLSATPIRKDGREEVIYAHIGPIKVKTTGTPLTPKVIVRRSPWRIPMTRIRTEEGARVGPVPHSPGRCGHVINMVAKHEGRNLLLVNFIDAAFKKGRRILVQSDRKEHLDNLMLMCMSCGIHQTSMSMYIGGMSSREREVAKQASIIFSTYGMTAEATDIPWLDTLVMATPKSDVKQIVGRILRLYEGKQLPIVFDLVDDSSSVFAGYWQRRKTFYESMKAEIVHKS